jgi:hypothetical protein
MSIRRFAGILLALALASLPYITGPAHADTYRITVDGYWFQGEGAQKKELEAAIRQQFPGCRIQFADDLSENKVRDMILTRSADVDVLMIRSEHGFLAQMVEKGMYSDLSDVSLVQERVAAMYDVLRQAITHAGQIAAYPLEMTIGPFQRWDAALAAQHGLREEKPATLEDVNALMQAYGDHDRLFDGRTALMYVNAYPLLHLSLDLYDAHMLAAESMLAYDTPLFRGLLQQAMRLRDESWRSEVIKQRMLDSVNQLSAHDILTTNPLKETELFLLRLNASTPPSAGVALTCAVVNPLTGHPEEARAVVAWLAARQTPAEQMLMMPSAQQPLINAHYEEELAQKQADIAAMEAAVDRAEGAERTQLENVLPQLRQQLEYMARERQYLISADRIAWYQQEVVPHLFVRGATPYESSQWAEIRDALIYQLMGGSLDEAGFIREMDSRVRLIRLESQ